MDARPLPSSPQSDLNRINEGINKLTVVLEDVIELNISVVFTTCAENKSDLKYWIIKQLEDW